MRRISTPTAAQDLFGPGKHGFRNGDPGNAILATRLQAEWFNALQEEICSVIDEAGIPLDSNDNSQLAEAIIQLIESNTIDSLNTLRLDVASAATVNLTTAAPNTRHINITGTTAITGFTVVAGRCYFVRFAGALTLTNGAGLVTQTGANIVTAVGDTCILRATADNVVEVLSYSPAILRALGEGQTWQNMTGSRALSTTYTNTTGRAIALWFVGTGATSAGAAIVINGVSMSGPSIGAMSFAQVIPIVIPAGATYSITYNSSINVWWELR